MWPARHPPRHARLPPALQTPLPLLGACSGRQIVKILRKLQASQELDEAEVAHCAKVGWRARRPPAHPPTRMTSMRARKGGVVVGALQVVGYIRRHKAQGHRMNTKTRDELEHARCGGGTAAAASTRSGTLHQRPPSPSWGPPLGSVPSLLRRARRWTCSLKNWGHDPLLDEDVGELLAS